MRLRVSSVKQSGPRARMYSLTSTDGGPLPAMTPGAHLELDGQLGELRWVRQYSLTNYHSLGQQPFVYEIVIQREAEGRGGSRWLYDTLHMGAEINVRGPVNQFPLEQSDHKVILIAGGIGITPILAMARSCQAQDRPYDLHLFCRNRSQTPLIDDVLELAGGRIFVHDGLDPEQTTHSLETLLDAQDRDFAPLYVCGPAGLIDAAVSTATAAGWAESSIQSERFSVAPLSGDTPFTAVLARTQARVHVAADESLLQALARHGVDVPSSCQTGTCGTCLTMVLDGAVDHRDTVLSSQEQSENSMMCICVSRAAGAELLVDL